ncbi:hypothetical protein DFQ26_008854 [Actinomortierella ambigua]|nr:hypothetical protein DFQ26_008854 [Actinomortierella ambigua]
MSRTVQSRRQPIWSQDPIDILAQTCTFLHAADQTIVSTTLVATAKDFNNLGDISWVGTVYLLTSTAVLPIYGTASDLFGRKRIFILAGAAQSMIMLILGRVIQGAGGGGIFGTAKTLVSDIVPRQKMGTYHGYIGFTYIFSSTIGPIAGGLISDGASWRWAYFINLPIGSLAFVFVAIFLHVKQPQTRTFRQSMAKVDYLGIVLLVASVMMVLLALNWAADAKYAWDSPMILSLLILGTFIGCLFLINEWRVGLASNNNKQPVIPLHLFGTLSLAANQICNLFQSAVYIGLIYSVPIYFQATAGLSSTQAGLSLIPLVATGAISSLLSGILMNKFNTTKESTVLGSIFGVLACGCLTLLLNEHTSRWVVTVILILQGLSLGLTANANLLNIYSELDSYRDIATSTALWAFLRTSGGTMGIAAVLASIQSSLSSAGVGEDTRNIGAIRELSPEIRGPIVRAFVVGMHRFGILGTVLCSIVLFSTVFIRRLPLCRPAPPSQGVVQDSVQREKEAA